MNIKNLSLKSILDEDWVFEPNFNYADVSGSAQLYGFDSVILYRKEDEKDICVVRFHAISHYDKKLFYIVNKLIADMGLDINMGDPLSKMIKKYGTPTFVYYVEEDYKKYYWRYPSDFYDYHDIFYIVYYHYLLSPDLLICFGVPKSDNRITDLEIVNDQKIISEIMEARREIKEYEKAMYQPKECLRFVKQRIENRKIIGITCKNIRFIKMEIENCYIEGIETEDIKICKCLFRNVIFDNHFKIGCISIEQCQFINCIFHDTFEENYIQLDNNLFQNCLFERIRMEEEGILNANRNRFSRCIFKEIRWNGEGVFCGSKIKEGMMEHIFYKTDDISYNHFSNIQMEHIEVELEKEGVGLFDNQFNTITFHNVTVKGPVEDTHFVDCDTTGLSLMGI